jgi:hypothetical protein
MAVKEKQKRALGIVQSFLVVLCLIMGLWIFFQYDAEKISQDVALFKSCILFSIFFSLDMIIAIITKQASIQAGTISRNEMPKRYQTAIALKIFLLVISILGIVYYW